MLHSNFDASLTNPTASSFSGEASASFISTKLLTSILSPRKSPSLAKSLQANGSQIADGAEIDVEDEKMLRLISHMAQKYLI